MGRPKKTWLDVYFDAECAYADNTIGAIGRVNLEGIEARDQALAHVVRGLVNLQSLAPGRTYLERVEQRQLRYITCDFLCRWFNIVPPWPLVDELGKPLKRPELKMIRLRGAVATSLFGLVSDVVATYGAVDGLSTPAEVWGCLMIEGACGLPEPGWLYSADVKNVSKSDAIAEYRRQTKQLTDREINPYPDGTLLKAFFDKAFNCANNVRSGDRFSIYERSYKPYLGTRSDLAKYVELKKSKTKMIRKRK